MYIYILYLYYIFIYIYYIIFILYILFKFISYLLYVSNLYISIHPLNRTAHAFKRIQAPSHTFRWHPNGVQQLTGPPQHNKLFLAQYTTQHRAM